jgi:hypothetical protein
MQLLVAVGACGMHFGLEIRVQTTVWALESGELAGQELWQYWGIKGPDTTLCCKHLWLWKCKGWEMRGFKSMLQRLTGQGKAWLFIGQCFKQLNLRICLSQFTLQSMAAQNSHHPQHWHPPTVSVLPLLDLAVAVLNRRCYFNLPVFVLLCILWKNSPVVLIKTMETHLVQMREPRYCLNFMSFTFLFLR